MYTDNKRKEKKNIIPLNLCPIHTHGPQEGTTGRTDFIATRNRTVRCNRNRVWQFWCWGKFGFFRCLGTGEPKFIPNSNCHTQFLLQPTVVYESCVGPSLGEFPSSRHPKASAQQHPTPYTLHPTPYILHPIPYTPHPTPYCCKDSLRTLEISILPIY